MKIATTEVSWTAYGAWAIPVCLAAALAVMQSAHAAAPALPSAAGSWRPTACPPPDERGSGPSSIKVTGPCAFQHKGEAHCEKDGDDFYVTVWRKARNSAEVMLFINVERFVGPGTYKPPNDIWVSLKDGSTIYRWSSNDYEVTVGPGSKYVTFKDARLEPELVLIGCTGPQTNYQCDGRGDEPRHMASSSTVSGRIYCKADGEKKP